MIILGTGILTWDRLERVTDRYGSVYLLNSGDSTTAGLDLAALNVPSALLGKVVKLFASVEETRKSTHIGDLFRGVFPRTPEKGAKILLGQGRLHTLLGSDGQLAVGVSPLTAEKAQEPWMLVRSLYDVHEQTVTLIVEKV